MSPAPTVHISHSTDIRHAYHLTTVPRGHDFTCIDIKPYAWYVKLHITSELLLTCLSARNVVLLTMVVDGESSTNAWNTFFHFRLNETSLSLLEHHCQKLIQASETPETWANSRYGSYLKMCTSHTLSELCRHWSSLRRSYMVSRQGSLQGSLPAVLKVWNHIH